MAFNPAAAISDRPTLLFDLGMIGSDYSSNLAGEESVMYKSTDLVPFIAMTLPIGERLGFGLNMGVPYARSGDAGENQSQRFHGIEGGILIMQLDSSLAYTVSDNLTVGAGASLASVRASSVVAIDTGAILFSLFDSEETESLIGEPLMEGTRTLEDSKAIGLGGNIGFRYRSDGGLEATGSYRSQINTTVQGKVLMRPSNVLNLVLEGELQGEVIIPMEAQYSITLPLGSFSLTAEGSWVDWSATSEISATVENMTVVSEDPEFLQLLEYYGLTEPELLGSTQSVGVNGYRDTFPLGARLSWSNSSLDITAGFMFAPNATPDEWVHPGNLDFQSIDYYAGVLQTINNNLSLGYSAAYFDIQDREITNSISNLTATAGTAPSVPSGNGSYSLGLWRVGLSVLYRL